MLRWGAQCERPGYRPQTPSTLYAATANAGVARSTDGGGSWGRVGLSSYSVWDALAVDPVTPATLYAGTRGGVFQSTDGGVSWSALNTGLTNLYVNTLAIDPQTPATLYAGTGAGVFVYTADRTPPVTTLTLAGPAGSNG